MWARKICLFLLCLWKFGGLTKSWRRRYVVNFVFIFDICGRAPGTWPKAEMALIVLLTYFFPCPWNALAERDIAYSVDVDQNAPLLKAFCAPEFFRGERCRNIWCRSFFERTEIYDGVKWILVDKGSSIKKCLANESSSRAGIFYAVFKSPKYD